MRRFQPKDLAIVNGWFKGHGQRKLTPDELPKTGAIVDDVAAGFLYLTDSSVSFLENFVSNPKASDRDVAKAIDKMVNELVKISVNGDRKKIFAFSKLDSIINAVKKSRSVGEYKMISREVH